MPNKLAPGCQNCGNDRFSSTEIVVRDGNTYKPTGQKQLKCLKCGYEQIFKKEAS